MTTLIVAFSLMLGTALAQDSTLNVAGSVSYTGNIQINKETPFFENLGKTSGLNLTVNYGPIDKLDMDPEEALDLVESRVVDIASLGIAVTSKRDPLLLGLDLVGMVTDYEIAEKVARAYTPVLRAHLRQNYNAHLLGVWPFGPQVLFCKTEISTIADVSGKRVRVYDANLGAVIEHLGGIAVPIKFSEVRRSLELDLIDCAITGPSSANTAGWVTNSKSTLPIGFQIAFNAYAINFDRWRSFSETERAKLTAAFSAYIDEVWNYSRELYEDALRCNVGAEPCTTVPSHTLTAAPVTDADRALIRNSLQTVSLPAWLESCAARGQDCETLWRGSVGEALGIQ